MKNYNETLSIKPSGFFERLIKGAPSQRNLTKQLNAISDQIKFHQQNLDNIEAKIATYPEDNEKHISLLSNDIGKHQADISDLKIRQNQASDLVNDIN